MVPNATDYAGGTHNSLLETARSGASRASDSSILAYDRLARSLQRMGDQDTSPWGINGSWLRCVGVKRRRHISRFSSRNMRTWHLSSSAHDAVGRFVLYAQERQRNGTAEIDHFGNVPDIIQFH